ncbi:hypothetical protein Avbf_13172 [Armadillidium vulgare]|nr:hypothetical protein Avbf_13172 [Armadillidium vulgare]
MALLERSSYFETKYVHRLYQNLRKFKRTWTHQEKERESSQLFQNACVEMQKLPGNEECSKFLVLHPNFKGRNWLHFEVLNSEYATRLPLAFPRLKYISKRDNVKCRNVV